jgi:hypothetical protein
VVAAVLAMVALRAVVARPLADTTDLPAERYRRRTADTITATLGLVVALPLATSAYLTHAALGDARACLPSVATLADRLLIVVVVVAVVAIGWYTALLLFPPRPDGATRDTPVMAAG